MKVEIIMFDGFLTLMELIDSVTIDILYCGVSRKYGVSTAIEVAQSATNNHQKIKTQNSWLQLIVIGTTNLKPDLLLMYVIICCKKLKCFTH